MRRRQHHRGPALRQREANRVLNLSGGYFVVTHQAGKDRQAGGIGGSPCPRTLLVGQQVPDRRRRGIPAPVSVGISAVQLVEKAIAVIQHEHVAIAIARIRIALDRRASRYRHRPRIAFVSVSCKSDADRRLGSAHHRVRNSDIRTLVLSRAKIGVHADGRSDEVDDGAGIRIHGRAGNILVPKIVAAEGTKSVEAGALSGAHCAASALASRPSRTHQNLNRPNRCLQIRFPTRPAAAGACSARVQSRACCAPAAIRAGKCQCQRGRGGKQSRPGKIMPLLSQEMAGEPCDVRPCPAENRDMYS